MPAFVCSDVVGAGYTRSLESNAIRSPGCIAGSSARTAVPAMVPCSAAVRGMVTLPPVGLIDGPLRQGGAVDLGLGRKG